MFYSVTYMAIHPSGCEPVVRRVSVVPRIQFSKELRDARESSLTACGGAYYAALDAHHLIKARPSSIPHHAAEKKKLHVHRCIECRRQ